MEENKEIREKFRKKPGLFSYAAKGFPLFLAGVLVGGGLSYKNHNKLVEIGNVTNFRVAESSVQHP
jgi:hypothetical protein